jgi:hypothetical protein
MQPEEEITNQMLYQLSYASLFVRHLVPCAGARTAPINSVREQRRERNPRRFRLRARSAFLKPLGFVTHHKTELRCNRPACENGTR